MTKSLGDKTMGPEEFTRERHRGHGREWQLLPRRGGRGEGGRARQKTNELAGTYPRGVLKLPRGGCKLNRVNGQTRGQ